MRTDGKEPPTLQGLDTRRGLLMTEVLGHVSKEVGVSSHAPGQCVDAYRLFYDVFSDLRHL